MGIYVQGPWKNATGGIPIKGEESSPKRKMLLIAYSAAILTVIVLSTGCIELFYPDQGGSTDPDPDLEPGPNGLLADPEVTVSSMDYSGDPYSVPYQDTHNKFSAVYNGSDLDIELRDEIMDVMKGKADDLSENGSLLVLCIESTYNDLDERPGRIPTYAEKCLWGDEDVWAIAFNRCNGWEDGIGHFDLYFVSIQDAEDIYVTGCYGCDSMSPVVAEYHCR
ncbi:MAG: hypothetical protein ACMUHM_08495 [Thermoplasmatota archaeon]